MEIKKAVITAAGRGVRLYPAADTVQKAMLPLVDHDGLSKPVIQVIAEEALASGIEEICIVCAPGDEEQYLRQFRLLRENLVQAHQGVAWAQDEAARLSDLMRRIQFAPQEQPKGYGHAVYCAKEFVAGEPFLLLLGDHVYISHVAGQRCAEQLMELARRESCAVAAVQATREHQVGRYGTLSGAREPNMTGVYRIETIIEKPSVSEAELELQTPGLRAGHYLCFFGIYVLTPTVFDILEQRAADAAELQLTPALHQLAHRERYLALEVKGARYDIGGRLGLFQAQLALGLASPVRDEMLTAATEILADPRTAQNPGPEQG
ncbi:MAG: NTP transferase domain-containing protein [Candidatus Hydrogenedentes bacterium]|nr:NTP transferase domain-containing protein [Candidatus Hydrogenedentota bacterium]